MGTCIICGTPVDGGHVCASHQEDVLFEFRGNNAAQLVSNRFYNGTVDGYADFGVFVDIAPGVTGLLHRSELDRRLDSLDWEPGDTVCVKVTNVRDNGNIDLAKSIRQSEREFRGKIILDGDGETLPGDEDADADAEEEPPDPESTPAEAASGSADTAAIDTDDTDDAVDESSTTENNPSPTDVTADPTPAEADGDAAAVTESTSDDVTAESVADTAGGTTDAGVEAEAVADTDADTNGTAAVAVADSDEADTDTVDADDADTDTVVANDADSDTTVTALTDQVGESVRLDGEIVSVRQTGGPTIFELRDETGVVDCAAFVEAGVRAYPDIEVGDVVRLDGEVEQRRGELQVETEELVALEGAARDAVTGRLADALTDRARPDELDPIGDHDTVAEMAGSLLDVAEAIRRAILESRPVVIRHPATAVLARRPTPSTGLGCSACTVPNGSSLMPSPPILKSAMWPSRLSPATPLISRSAR